MLDTVHPYVRTRRRITTQEYMLWAKRWLGHAKNIGKIIISQDACPCTGNHYALSIGDKQICPLRFWLGIAAISDSERAAMSFLEKHPLNQLTRRVNPEQDAYYKPELEWKDER